MTPESFKHWRKRQSLTQTEASALLGISVRMLINYEQGDYPIPLTVALAAAAIEAGLQPAK